MIDVEEMRRECEWRAAAYTGEERRFFLKLVYLLDEYIRVGKLLEQVLEQLKEKKNGLDRR